MKLADQLILLKLDEIKAAQGGGGGGSTVWGGIGGTLGNQTDLSAALALKQTAAQVQALIDGTVTKSVAATAHGFAVGDVLRMDGANYVKAQADSEANAEVVGMVATVPNANNFTLATFGYVSGLSGLTAGTTYFLDPATAGALTATEPSSVGQVSKPVFIAVSATAGYFFNMRGVLIEAPSGASYLVYTALLTQSGSPNAPVDTVLLNTLGGTVVWSYDTNGLYIATLASAFTNGKTVGYTGSVRGFTQVTNLSVDTVQIRTRNAAESQADDILSDTFFEIRVYP